MSATMTGFLIGLAPLALLVVLLLLGRYPGESSLVRARRALDGLLARAVSVSIPVLRLTDTPGTVRGRRLVAESLAGRGPPFAG